MHDPLAAGFSGPQVDQSASAHFELIAARCELRSIMITANQPFSGWAGIIPDRAMTVAAIDRLVRRAMNFEMNVESDHRCFALAQPTSLRGKGDIAKAPRRQNKETPTPSSGTDT